MVLHVNEFELHTCLFLLGSHTCAVSSSVWLMSLLLCTGMPQHVVLPTPKVLRQWYRDVLTSGKIDTFPPETKLVSGEALPTVQGTHSLA